MNLKRYRLQLYNSFSFLNPAIKICIGIFLLASCDGTQPEEGPAVYDFSNPEKTIMKDDLLEISGITFLNDSSHLPLAINDEQGKLYFLNSVNKRPGFSRFSKPADYEDVALVNNSIFVLRSDGTLFSFPSDSIINKKVSAEEWKKILPKGEYESLHSRDNKLYVLCKECDQEKKQIQGYELELNNDSIITVKPFSIDIKKVRDQYDLKFGFRASALAWNLATKEWYIISSVNKLLMITDGDWKIKTVYALNPKIFIQPEGIAFDEDQNLYVSNEGNETRNGNILKFTFHPNDKQ
ncbi:MAG: SdiA-regulated family protein [Chryseolinea sp.]